MRTKIVNTTTHVLKIMDVVSLGKLIQLASVPAMQTFKLKVDPNATYMEYYLVVRHQGIFLSTDDVEDAAEITVYETHTQKLEWRLTRMRGLKHLQPEDNIRDWTAFNAVKKDAFSRMQIIEKSHASVVILSKQVKICPAQCQNLVQTCLKGVKEMKEAYDEKSEDDMWQLYSSKKLGQLISSLDRLLSTLGSIHDLLQACGSNWGSMALVVSLPLPPTERVYSKFDILIKELHWNLETIHYALHLNKVVEFKWNERKFRYVLEGIARAKVTVAEDMELEQSRQLASEDQLQKRLKETAGSSNDSSSIPDCFWINNADLKLRHKLSGNSTSKSVWKGEWCGQPVAIGITKYTTKAAVEKEAGLMLKVQHPNIVGFLGCAFTDDAPPPVCSGEDDKCSAGYLVMELMHEDLWHVIDRHAKSHFGSPFTLAVIVDILLQIAEAMVHMHNLDIMHRDLKSANCLVNERSSSNSSLQVLNFHTLKLIDFELSKSLDPNAAISNHTANTGTRRWMAPEVWGLQISDANSLERPFVPYTTSADVWSFGMTCYEVITGLLPFSDCVSNSDLLNALRDLKRPSIPASVSCPEGLKALMLRCWAQEPSDRPDFKAIEKDLWTIKYQLEIR